MVWGTYRDALFGGLSKVGQTWGTKETAETVDVDNAGLSQMQRDKMRGLYINISWCIGIILSWSLFRILLSYSLFENFVIVSFSKSFCHNLFSKSCCHNLFSKSFAVVSFENRCDSLFLALLVES